MISPIPLAPNQAWYNENEPFAVLWLERLIQARHISQGIVNPGSIKSVRAAEVVSAARAHFFAGLGVWDHALHLADWPPGIPVWSGSCPCQPFSVAGQGLGEDDPRHLWPVWRELIAECRPPVVFGEQVASAAGRAWLASVRADLEALGYAVGAADLCAAGAGAPHIRQRLFFGAARLADAEGRGRGEQWCSPVSRHLRHADGGVATLSGLRLGHTEVKRHQGDQPTRKREQGRKTAQRIQSASDDDNGWLADAPGGLFQEQKRGTQGRDGAGPDREDHGGSSRWTGEDAAGWADPDWLWCRDQKWRPVEPGTFPLVDGLAGRMGRLRASEEAKKDKLIYWSGQRRGMLMAYGNAIVAPLAATFILSFLESIFDQDDG